jgi:hypothetical protein
MSSLFVQVTVVPTGTVSVWGPKTKLSILTAAFTADGRSLLALTLVDPANSSSIAIITGVATPATFILFFVIFCFLCSFFVLARSCLFGSIVLQPYGRPFEIFSGVVHVLLELCGRGVEKDLLNAWRLRKLLSEDFSCAPCFSISLGPRQLAAGSGL